MHSSYSIAVHPVDEASATHREILEAGLQQQRHLLPQKGHPSNQELLLLMWQQGVGGCLAGSPLLTA